MGSGVLDQRVYFMCNMCKKHSWMSDDRKMENYKRFICWSATGWWRKRISNGWWQKWNKQVYSNGFAPTSTNGMFVCVRCLHNASVCVYKHIDTTCLYVCWNTQLRNVYYIVTVLRGINELNIYIYAYMHTATMPYNHIHNTKTKCGWCSAGDNAIYKTKGDSKSKSNKYSDNKPPPPPFEQWQTQYTQSHKTKNRKCGHLEFQTEIGSLCHCLRFQFKLKLLKVKIKNENNNNTTTTKNGQNYRPSLLLCDQNWSKRIQWKWNEFHSKACIDILCAIFFCFPINLIEISIDPKVLLSESRSY